MNNLYIYPPHPASSQKMAPEELDKYERTNLYVAQRKFNGARAVIIIQNGNVEIYNRHKEEFKNLKVTRDIINLFLSLNIKSSDCVILDGEFLGTKAVSKITQEQAVKETIVVFDVLYYNKNLYQVPQMERLALLDRICRSPKQLEPKKRAFSVGTSGNASLWLAEVFYDDFSYHFYEFYDYDEQKRDIYPEIEGLILRKKNGLLKAGNKKYDTNEMLRCRKPNNRSGRF